VAVAPAGSTIIGAARALFEVALRACIFALFARTFVVQAFVIPTGSMEPNLRVGDHVLVNKFIYGGGEQPRRSALPQRPVGRGDVVVFRHPQAPAEALIKRCVGLAGDQVELDGKQLVINGQVVDERALVAHRDPQIYERGLGLDPRLVTRDSFGPYVVPAGEVFCLGDNRDNSNDSRFWGSVPSALIKGRAVFIYWSVESPLAIRWSRMFRVVR
jgi:signal peptidase I